MTRAAEVEPLAPKTGKTQSICEYHFKDIDCGKIMFLN